LTSFLNAVSTDIQNKQKEQGRVASGKSLAAYEVEVDEFSGKLYGINYVGTLETGRKAGRVPKFFRTIILEWMNQKSLFQAESESKRKSIAYLIARKIANDGTKLHRDGGKSGVLSTVVTEQRINMFSNEILESLQNDTLNQMVAEFAR